MLQMHVPYLRYLPSEVTRSVLKIALL
uniref:F-box domain-containing protein n=1 Tax=Heterorhabditis bacteriophora TaxID=37862 RepID=A0A1I7WBX0_HETBA